MRSRRPIPVQLSPSSSARSTMSSSACANQDSPSLWQLSEMSYGTSDGPPATGDQYMTTVLEGPPSRAEERSAEAQWAIPQPRARRQKREDGEGKVGAGEAPDSWKVPQLQKSHKGRWIAR